MSKKDTYREPEKKISVLETKLAQQAKELACISELSELVESKNKINDILTGLAHILKKNWQFPDHTEVKITSNNFTYKTTNFRETQWLMHSNIIVKGRSVGEIRIAYLENKTNQADPFLKQEYNLLNNVSERLGKIIERLQKTELLDHLFEGILEADKDGIIRDANQQIADLSGYNSPDELIGRPMTDLYANPDDREELIKRLKQKGGNLYNFEFLLKKKDNSSIYTFCNARMLFNIKGESLGTIGAFTDISEKKKAEQELIESEKALKRSEYFLNEVQKISKIGGWEYNVETGETYFSDEIFNIYALPKNRMFKVEEGTEFYHPDDRILVSEAFTKAISDGISYDLEVRFINARGENLWVKTAGKPISENGKIVKILGTLLDITERKVSEQALKESEEKFRALYNNAPLSYQSLNFEGCFIDVNPMWLKTLGYDRNEIIGKWFGDFLHPDYVDHFRKNFPAFKKRGYVSDVQFKIRKKDNTFIYVSFEGCISYTPEGEFKQTYCVFKDITEQRKVEQALKESEEKFRNLFETSQDGIAITDIEGQFMDCNKSFLNMLGYDSIEKVRAKSYQEITPKEYHQQEKKIIEEETFVKGYCDEYEKEYIKKDGSRIPVRLRAWLRKDSKNIPTGMWVLVRDITESKKKEAEIIKIKDLLNETGKLAKVGGWEIDIEGNTLIWTDETFQMHEMNSQNPPNVADAIKFYHPDDRDMVASHVEKAVSEGVAFSFEARLITKKQNQIWVRAAGKPVFNNGKLVSIIGSIQDITQKKENEIELTKLNADKDKFMSILAHDLKNPFNTLLGFTQLLQINIHNYDIDRIEKQVGIINDTAKKTYRLLEEILEWSRAQSGKIVYEPDDFKLYEACELILEEITNQAQAKGIFVKCNLSNQLSVYTDLKLVETILRNLISNAIKFTDKAGIITIDAKETDNETIVSVTDTGVGIEKDTLKQLFNIAIDNTTKGTNNEEGTGLGLQICKEFTEIMGGKIWAQSEPGKGSVFYFSIPKQK